MIMTRLATCLVCTAWVPKGIRVRSAVHLKAAPFSSEVFHQYAEKTYSQRQQSMHDKTCPHCFFPLQFCMCKDVKSLFDEAAVQPKAHISLFMHHKEYGRVSNTGKILTCGLPDRSKLYIYGVEKDHQALSKSLCEQPSIILYPSKNSQPLSNFKDWYAKEEIVNLCVIDSTWSQSNTMDKYLPSHIPRVRVDDFVFEKSQFLNRKQSDVAGRVSTLEAVAIALRGLGEPEAALQPMYKALQLCVDATLCVRGKQLAYGHNFVSKMTSAGDAPLGNGIFTGRTVPRPSHCLVCHASSETIIMKNLGVRKSGTTDSAFAGQCDDQPVRTWQCQNCKGTFFTPLAGGDVP